MSGCRFRYEDLSAHLRAQVDALSLLRPDARPGRARRGAAAGTTLVAGKNRRREPNKTEAAYRAEMLGGRRDVVAVHYEGLTLRMANGHRYTPDWVVVTAAGRIECHEVKGGYALHSQQRARLAFDQARIEFPWIVWTWATKTESGWRV